MIMAVVNAVHGHEGEVTGLFKTTQVQLGEGVGDATRLLGLDGFAVERVEVDAFGGRVVHLVHRGGVGGGLSGVRGDLHGGQGTCGDLSA